MNIAEGQIKDKGNLFVLGKKKKKKVVGRGDKPLL